MDLTQAGLTQNESKAYETLVKNQVLTSTELSAKSTVPYGRIYDVLGSLSKKGLVRVIPGKTKKFTATSPQDLIKLIEKKESDLAKTKEDAKALKKFYEKKEKEVVSVAYGDKGFWKLADELGSRKKYGYNIRWTSVIRPDSIQKIKKSLRTGLDIKQLVRYDDETKRTVDKRIRHNPQIRKIENDGVAMAIQDNGEVLIGLIKSNATLLIRDKAFAKVMTKMFLETYKNAEKVK